MPANLNVGFVNNINTIQVRTSGSSMQRLTDRAIDVDGDGNVEVVTISGFGTSAIITKPVGIARSVVDQTFESDGGINVSGSEFTTGS